jgi:hypothetical protein
MFVRAECASELQCRDSPGPIYSPTFSNLPRAQTVNWGSKRSQENVSRFHANHHFGGRDSMGPAAYHPLAQHILPQATQVHFGKSSRFDSFGGHAFAINNSPYTGGHGGDVRLCLAARTHTRELCTALREDPWLVSSSLTCWRVCFFFPLLCALFSLQVKVDYVRPRSAAYSFSGGRVRPPRGDDPDATRSRPRTAFLTHSIRGGLAKSATLESGVGPADYSTDQHAIERRVKGPNLVGKGFGSAPRFTRPGLVFVSAAHANADGNVFSPGPKYAYEAGSMTFKQRQPQSSLHWTP